MLICSTTTLLRFGDLLVSASRLVGKKVIGSNAYMLGEITGADVDTEKWLVTHLHVGLTDEANENLDSENRS